MSMPRAKKPREQAQRQRDRRAQEERARAERDTAEAVGQAFALSDDVRDWYDKYMGDWHRHVHKSAELARELAAQLRAGSVSPPPWPDVDLGGPTFTVKLPRPIRPRAAGKLDTSGPIEEELTRVLDVLDESVQLDEKVRVQLQSILEWAKVTTPGRSRPSEAVQAIVAEAILAEDEELSKTPHISGLHQ